jgi:hypothetical protein
VGNDFDRDNAEVDALFGGAGIMATSQDEQAVDLDMGFQTGTGPKLKPNSSWALL